MADVPLIRVHCKLDGQGAWDPCSLLRSPVLHPHDKGQTARLVEREFELGDSLYFYAGHACPGYGLIALVYEHELGGVSDGHATPFDTGWLWQNEAPLRLLGDLAARKEYLHSVRHPLAAWLTPFRAYLADYFRSPCDYVLGERPLKEPEAPYRHPFSDRVGWTWEIQTYQPHDLFQGLRLFCVAFEVGERLRAASLDEDAGPLWENFFDDEVRFVQVGMAGEFSSEAACAEAERRIAEWL